MRAEMEEIEKENLREFSGLFDHVIESQNLC